MIEIKLKNMLRSIINKSTVILVVLIGLTSYSQHTMDTGSALENKGSIFGRAWFENRASYGDKVVVTDVELTKIYGVATTKRGGKNGGSFQINELPVGIDLLVFFYRPGMNYLYSKKIMLSNAERKKVTLIIDVNHNDYGTMEIIAAIPILANEVISRVSKKHVISKILYLESRINDVHSYNKHYIDIYQEPMDNVLFERVNDNDESITLKYVTSDQELRFAVSLALCPSDNLPNEIRLKVRYVGNHFFGRDNWHDEGDTLDEKLFTIGRKDFGKTFFFSFGNYKLGNKQILILSWFDPDRNAWVRTGPSFADYFNVNQPPSPKYVDFLNLKISDNLEGLSSTDIRDNYVYKEMKIGDYIWFAHNLNVDIENSWIYKNNSFLADALGRLYTWESAINACPEGWHLPSKIEWENLISVYSELELINTQLWGLDVLSGKSGFNAIPAGFKYGDDYGDIGELAIFWSSTRGDNGPFIFVIDGKDGDNFIELTKEFKNAAFSCRCIKNIN